MLAFQGGWDGFGGGGGGGVTARGWFIQQRGSARRFNPFARKTTMTEMPLPLSLSLNNEIAPLLLYLKDIPMPQFFCLER